MHVEPDFEALLERLVPGCSEHWAGATTAEVEELERFAGRPLPPFYRWFLLRMGRAMMPVTIPRRDMTVGALLASYRRGFQPPRPTLLLLGIEDDDVMPMCMYYDLDIRIRNDALVCSYEKGGGTRQSEFETLRERLAWGVFGRTRLATRQRCQGSFEDRDRKVLEKLEPVLNQLGFETLHHTGPRCGLYERGDVAIECSIPAGGELPPYMFFDIAGDEIAIRTVLGAIGVETTLDVEIDKWTPASS